LEFLDQEFCKQFLKEIMILLKFDILLDNILILLTLQLLYCNEYCNIYIASITSQKPVMQAFSVLDCSVEPHLLIVLVKVKNFFWQNVPATFVWKPVSVMSKLALYMDVKR